jgi:lipoprotein-anchoring transpeptidase ErfK/SrfK
MRSFAAHGSLAGTRAGRCQPGCAPYVEEDTTQPRFAPWNATTALLGKRFFVLNFGQLAGILGVAVFGGLVVASVLTGCFGAGYVWTSAEPTVTPTPTITPTPTPTATATPTPTPTSTNTPTPLPTNTPGPTRPAAQLPPPGAGERWVDVDLSDQTAKAMVGNRVFHTAQVSTGKPGWETPIGTFQIRSRVYNETMTSASIGAEEYYVLTDVLFTQYFTNQGHALHLNYWRPDSVFGNQATSHGCVGMRYADAEYFWNFATYGTRVVIHQ